MSDNSAIEWTDATWNPVTGCTQVSPGCDHCYALTFAERFRGVPGHPYEQGFDMQLWPERLALPLAWTKPRRIVVNSMSDLFHQDIPTGYIAAVFDTMKRADWHVFQVLTKRPGRLRRVANQLPWPEHIWAGVSIESEKFLWRVNGSPVGTELVNTASPTSDTTQTFTVPGLTRAQLLDGAFTVRVRATRGNSNTAFTASLDAVSVAVDYSVPGTTTLTTNANGNLVAKGTDTFAYDQANRLIAATVAGVTETYAYNGDGVRFSRTVGAGPAIRYVSDINASLPVTLDDGTRKYVWGLGLAYAVSGSSIEVYHADRLGSVRAITDATGAVTATYRTDEYGVPTASTGSSGQPFTFTGEPRDATGLSYLRARYYDPALGRFMSRDSWAGSANRSASLNRAAYVMGNPVTYSDPSGMKALALDSEPSAIYGMTKRDIKLFDDAVAQCEREIGPPRLTGDERRRLHDLIHGQGYGFREIVAECKAEFGPSRTPQPGEAPEQAPDTGGNEWSPYWWLGPLPEAWPDSMPVPRFPSPRIPTPRFPWPVRIPFPFFL